MNNRSNCGRKKINCILGEKSPHCFWCYPIEYQKLKIEFEKLKKERPKYYIKESKNDKAN